MITGSKYYKSLPRKRLAAEVIFTNRDGEILLVKPTYKNRWGVPGGIVENNESPRCAAIREIKEELNLEIKNLPLAAVDYSIPSGPKDESIMFVFCGGVLNDSDIKKIRLPPDELSEFKFVPIGEAKTLTIDHEVHISLPERLEAGLNAVNSNNIVYLEDGKKV